MNITKFNDVHEYCFLFSFLQGVHCLDEVLSQDVQSIIIVALSLNELLNAVIPLLAKFKFFKNLGSLMNKYWVFSQNQVTLLV